MGLAAAIGVGTLYVLLHEKKRKRKKLEQHLKDQPISKEMLLKIRALRQRCAPTPRTAGRASFAMQVPSTEERGAKPIFGPAPSREELSMQGAKFVTLPRALFDEMYTLCEAQRQGAGGQDVREQFASLMQTVSLQAGRGELGRVQEG